MALKILFLSSLLFCLPRPAAAAPEIQPQNIQAEELSVVRDRLATSLFARGELADKIIAAGMEGTFVDVEGMETHAEVRSALLNWIRRNPDKAAQASLHLKTGAAALPGKIELRETVYELNPRFLERIKALSEAAGDRNVSNEALELASRRLYEGPQAEDEGAVVMGGAAGRPAAYSPLNYADYRLNQGGLDKELGAAGAWLEAARGAGAADRRFYGEAFREYSAFLVAASALKGRSAITAQESGALEARRAALRARLSALALGERAYDLENMAAVLKARGAVKLAGLADRLAARLSASALEALEGGASMRSLSAVSASAEREFSSFYLSYSAYNSLVRLRELASPGGFSCLYDYAAYRYLAAFFPGAAYPKARRELAAARPALDEALLRADAGDMEGALSGAAARAAELKGAAALAASASAFNRRAQFLLWGVLFRPAELAVSARGGRAAFRPALTFFEVLRR
ncbi:MAG: hypothetical protein A2X31_01035 [Elusimicrobia bacterium GWB2_63_22]|nr:MAG: hypothetical protein A2X31_01035 [Elusimicrobia bacterium GWB2_63_22]